MGKSQRDKGYRGEANLRHIFQDAGINCKRVPLSGGAPGSPGDLLIGAQEDRSEVKIRGDGFKTLYGWLADNKFLFVKADRKDYLAVMNINTLIQLFKGRDDAHTI